VVPQYHNETVLHPVAYHSKNHTPAECNYNIYDTERLGITNALEEGRPESKGAAYPLQLLPDLKNLEYFMTKMLLNRRQACWSEFLTQYNYQIVIKPAKSNGNADASTRRPGDHPVGGDERLNNMEQVV